MAEWTGAADAGRFAVTVEPRATRFPADPGETVMAAARRAGLWWPTICGGVGACTACACEVMDDGSGLADPSKDERDAVGRAARGGVRNGRPLRLACQAAVVGDVRVLKRGVKPLTPEGEG